jgi:anti-sigma regulatory factor (Ser/Thr protein kinase)
LEGTIHIQAQIDSLGTVRSFLNDSLDAAHCPSSVRYQIELAVEELFVNIANYAYEKKTGDAEITIDCKTENQNETMTIIIKDSGKEFNPLKHADPDVSTPLGKRELGGLGLLLVKQFMDDVQYEYFEGFNKTTLKKIWKRENNVNI